MGTKHSLSVKEGRINRVDRSLKRIPIKLSAACLHVWYGHHTCSRRFGFWDAAEEGIAIGEGKRERGAGNFRARRTLAALAFLASGGPPRAPLFPWRIKLFFHGPQVCTPKMICPRIVVCRTWTWHQLIHHLIHCEGKGLYYLYPKLQSILTFLDILKQIVTWDGEHNLFPYFNTIILVYIFYHVFRYTLCLNT